MFHFNSPMNTLVNRLVQKLKIESLLLYRTVIVVQGITDLPSVFNPHK